MRDFSNESRDAGAGDDPAIVGRVAPALRSPERLGAAFEARVMNAVRAEAASANAPARETRGWWLRSRELRISPLGALALAAGFAVMVGAGTLGVAKRGRAEVAIAPSPPAPVQVVRFVYVDPSAKDVAVAGDFNGWDAKTTPLAAAGVNGVWTVSVPLRAGRHEYAFIVDHKRWTADPLERKSTDEFNTESSVLNVGESER